ncbi:hypothetical protein [Halobacillus sp. H74]|uniref:hypothetical protein n=1 Tax=Halobacillus sp. H74 TaxID=3457436 RepID=UPI003FCC3429
MRFFLVITMFILLTGCGVSSQPVQSIEGPVTSVKIGGIEVECSAAVKRNVTGAAAATEEGYPCLVLMPEDIPVKTADGDTVSMQAFREQAKEEDMLDVKVVLANEKDIGEDPESRELTAAEVVILD